MSKKGIAAILAAAMIVSQTGVFAQEVMAETDFDKEVIVQPRYVAISTTENDLVMKLQSR